MKWNPLTDDSIPIPQMLAHELKHVYELELVAELMTELITELITGLITELTGPGEHSDHDLALLVKCAEDLIPRKPPVSITRFNPL